MNLRSTTLLLHLLTIVIALAAFDGTAPDLEFFLQVRVLRSIPFFVLGIWG